jgi:hypothetical protein
MPLHKFLHNILNVLVQIANKMGLQKNYVLQLLVGIVRSWTQTMEFSLVLVTTVVVLHCASRFSCGPIYLKKSSNSVAC